MGKRCGAATRLSGGCVTEARPLLCPDHAPGKPACARFLLNVEHVRHRLRFLLIPVKQGVQSVCFMIGVTTCNSRRQSSSVGSPRPKGALGRHECESSLLFCREAVGDCARVGFFVCFVLNPAVRRAFILE